MGLRWVVGGAVVMPGGVLWWVRVDVDGGYLSGVGGGGGGEVLGRRGLGGGGGCVGW